MWVFVPAACTCVRVFRCDCNRQLYPTRLTEGRKISRHLMWQSFLLRTVRRLHLEDGHRFDADPCHPHPPFLATVSLALLSFPPTPPHCAYAFMFLELDDPFEYDIARSPSIRRLSSPPSLPPLHSPLCYFLLVFARMSDRCLLQMPSCSWEAVVRTAWQAACVCACLFLCARAHYDEVWRNGREDGGGRRLL